MPGMSRRLRSEGGFTLPELLTTMWIAGVIMLAAFALVDFVMKRTAEAEQRVEATQRGRTGMDMITRQLRSQVCLTAATPPIVDGTADSITFYTDLGNSTASSLPEKHTLTFNAAAGTMTETVQKPNATNPVTWKAATTKTMIAGIARDKTSAGLDIPVFQYRGFDNTTTPVQISSTNLAVPLLANANNGNVAMVKITFRSVARRTPRSEVSFAIADDVYSRVINPNPPDEAPANYTPTPSCN
jgi:prepilin-type N-terminal cleavage/methylation domain-containing protein